LFNMLNFENTVIFCLSELSYFMREYISEKSQKCKIRLRID